MKCSLCNKPIDYEIKFSDLFCFEFVCKNCHKLINEKLEVIPLDNGHILKHYYFVNEDEYIENIESKISKSIERIVLNNKNSIIMLDDVDELKLIPILGLIKNITIISIFYEDYSFLFDNETIDT